MKKLKIEGKLKLNKELILKLNEDELGNVKGGWTGSIGFRCTNEGGTCGDNKRSKGWACNDDIAGFAKLMADIAGDAGC